MIENTHQRAVLAGSNDEQLTLQHLPKDSGVSIGARIVTSGHDGILPPNVLVGIVSAIDQGRVYILPLADLDQLHFVQVIDYAGAVQDDLFIERAAPQLSP